MMREFVQLCQRVDKWKTKLNLADYYLSEKLDGVRCLWVPWTRGKLVSHIGFANRFKDNRDLVSSGLWSRGAKPIFCPDWFVNSLPASRMVDGELFCGVGRFQDTVSAVRKLIPIESEWLSVSFVPFDLPSIDAFYRGGKIRFGKNYLTMPGSPFNLNEQALKENTSLTTFQHVYRFMKAHGLAPLDQTPLNSGQTSNIEYIEAKLKEIYLRGGEGVVLRSKTALWEPKRTINAVKLTDSKDSEATITGFSNGEGRLSGMLGAINVLWDGLNETKVEFSIGTGLSDAERMNNHSGSPIHFKIGETITFKYRELTDLGVPKQPRYSRKRDLDY